MEVSKRLLASRLLERMRENPQYAKQIGLHDQSQLHHVPVTRSIAPKETMINAHLCCRRRQNALPFGEGAPEGGG